MIEAYLSKAPSVFLVPGRHDRGPSQQFCFYFYIQVVFLFIFILLEGWLFSAWDRSLLPLFSLYLFIYLLIRKGLQPCRYSIPRTFFSNWEDAQLLFKVNLSLFSDLVYVCRHTYLYYWASSNSGILRRWLR